MSAPPLVDVVSLFPGLNQNLAALLRSLRPDDWMRSTVCREWSVKDIAAHILDGQLRRLAFGRDAYIPAGPSVTQLEETVRLINRLNADWVRAAQRLSPRVLIDHLEWAGPQLAEYFQSLDPYRPATFPVAWAGESSSANWFDIARDYTEQWHHQQQIRDAVHAPPLTARKWLNPVLATFVRCLPHAYRETMAAEGAAVQFEVTGDAGDCWCLRRQNSVWNLTVGPAPDPNAGITLDSAAAWRLFTRGLTPSEARRAATLTGDQALAAVALHATAVM